MNQLTAIFLGPQGSGKGTQVGLLKDYLAKHDPERPVMHLDMGASLREFGKSGGYTQELVHASLLRGELQPAFLSSYLMAKFFVENLKGDEHLVIDGFPREIVQAEIFDTAMRFYKREPFLLLINISDDEAVARLLKRGRADDTEESIRHRLSWSRAQVMPTVEAYRKNPLYRVMDVDGARPVEEVHQDILRKLGLQAQ